ncbi:MAG: dihydropteroate synthase [Chloroflexi bacterium]|nr:dihydropteroate synthase [Chloroflexota bacterium]
MLAAVPPIQIGGRRFEWGLRTYLMGIVNVTPDSFSGDGVLDPARAADQAARMVAEGADLIDVGAESTRPGHAPLSVDDEWTRLEAPLRAIRAAVDAPITVDTSKAGVAERAFDVGADALNDVGGLLGDAGLAPLLARRELPAVVMHNQRDRTFGGDVIGDIRVGLRESIEAAKQAGVDAGRLILDPGFGFGWEPAQNLEMVRRLGELRELGRPLLVGVSRKSTLGLVLNKPEPERLWGTAAAVALAVQAGADIVRVQDVAEMSDVVRIADAATRPGAGP